MASSASPSASSIPSMSPTASTPSSAPSSASPTSSSASKPSSPAASTDSSASMPSSPASVSSSYSKLASAISTSRPGPPGPCAALGVSMEPAVPVPARSRLRPAVPVRGRRLLAIVVAGGDVFDERDPRDLLRELEHRAGDRGVLPLDLRHFRQEPPLGLQDPVALLAQDQDLLAQRRDVRLLEALDLLEQLVARIVVLQQLGKDGHECSNRVHAARRGLGGPVVEARDRGLERVLHHLRRLCVHRDLTPRSRPRGPTRRIRPSRRPPPSAAGRTSAPRRSCGTGGRPAPPDPAGCRDPR